MLRNERISIFIHSLKRADQIRAYIKKQKEEEKQEAGEYSSEKKEIVVPPCCSLCCHKVYESNLHKNNSNSHRLLIIHNLFPLKSKFYGFN